MPSKILLVGGGGREDAIARKIVESGGQLYAVLKNRNPSILSMASDFLIGDELDHERIADYAKSKNVDLAFIGPDPVLNTPLADTLLSMGIRVASPTRKAAEIETSKSFMRNLLAKYEIAGNVPSIEIHDEESLDKAIKDSQVEYAIKPVGLTGGKGVRVMGEHFDSRKQAHSYALEVLRKDGVVLLEQRISGEEFSQMIFTDGTHMIPVPVAQDFKRALEGDQGPNTAGMGSITDANHLLPFMDSETRERSLKILSSVLNAMRMEGREFRGVMYGQFMSTPDGPKVIEINARLADPEGINILSLLHGDIVEVLNSIADGSLRGKISFRNKATTLKYLVPPGYGFRPRPGRLTVDSGIETDDLKLYYAAVSGSMENVEMSSSRALAVVGIADTIPEASSTVERSLGKIHGEYYVRHDIGSNEMMSRKIRIS